MAKKKAPPFKKGGIKGKLNDAFGKMKQERFEERAAARAEKKAGKCGKGCDCGK